MGEGGLTLIPPQHTHTHTQSTLSLLKLRESSRFSSLCYRIHPLRGKKNVHVTSHDPQVENIDDCKCLEMEGPSVLLLLLLLLPNDNHYSSAAAQTVHRNQNIRSKEDGGKKKKKKIGDVSTDFSRK